MGAWYNGAMISWPQWRNSLAHTSQAAAKVQKFLPGKKHIFGAEF